MAIEWFNATKGMPTVTIARYGINLNSAASDYFVNVSKVRLGYDKRLRKVFIQPCDEKDIGGVKFPYCNEAWKSVRISCKDFIQLIAITFDIDINTSDKYYAFWDEENKMLAVELNKKLSKNDEK